MIRQDSSRDGFSSSPASARAFDEAVALEQVMPV
jgi:hypothetical protein